MKPSSKRLILIFLFLFLTVFISGCAQAGKISSLQISSKSFIRDSTGLPIVVLLVGEVNAGKDSVDYTCKPTYSGELVDEAISQKTSGGKDSFTITTPASGRLDINKWGVCCDTGTLDSKTSTTVCED